MSSLAGSLDRFSSRSHPHINHIPNISFFPISKEKKCADLTPNMSESYAEISQSISQPLQACDHTEVTIYHHAWLCKPHPPHSFSSAVVGVKGFRKFRSNQMNMLALRLIIWLKGIHAIQNFGSKGICPNSISTFAMCLPLARPCLCHLPSLLNRAWIFCSGFLSL